MFGAAAQVSHDQLRPAEDPGVEALQDEVRGCGASAGHQEGVMDIAVAVRPDVQDPALRSELLGYGK